LKTFSIIISSMLVFNFVPAFAVSGRDYHFNDSSSNALVQQAWASLSAQDLDAVKAYVGEADRIYAAKAKAMQMSLRAYPSGSKAHISQYWALNDVGTAWFILGEAYRDAGKKELAAQAYRKVIKEYSFAQCWDAKGWFWNPTEIAQQKLTGLDLDWGFSGES